MIYNNILTHKSWSIHEYAAHTVRLLQAIYENLGFQQLPQGAFSSKQIKTTLKINWL